MGNTPGPTNNFRDDTISLSNTGLREKYISSQSLPLPLDKYSSQPQPLRSALSLHFEKEDSHF